MINKWNHHNLLRQIIEMKQKNEWKKQDSWHNIQLDLITAREREKKEIKWAVL